MSAPDHYVYDGHAGSSTAPRRPTEADLGGTGFVDDQEYPPDPTTMPNAAMAIQQVKALAGIARVSPVAIIGVTFSGGTPSISEFRVAGTLVVAGDLTVTDNGNGDTTIEWPADTFPASSTHPALTLNADVDIQRQYAVRSGDSVQVVTRDGSGTGTDCDFTVFVY